jgi:hypothetical protein
VATSTGSGVIPNPRLPCVIKLVVLLSCATAGSRLSWRDCSQKGIDRVEVSASHVPIDGPRHYLQQSIHIGIVRIVTRSNRIMKFFQREAGGFSRSIWSDIGRRKGSKYYASSQIVQVVKLHLPARCYCSWTMSGQIRRTGMAIVTSPLTVYDIAG